MASKRPSFLKRQKEQKRLERANEKRIARQQRREARASGEMPESEDLTTLESLLGEPADTE
jgi:hypothetical protein